MTFGAGFVAVDSNFFRAALGRLLEAHLQINAHIVAAGWSIGILLLAKATAKEGFKNITKTTKITTAETATKAASAKGIAAKAASSGTGAVVSKLVIAGPLIRI